MLNISTLPLMNYDSPASIVAIWNGHSVSYEQFVMHVNEVSKNLPNQSYSINLCEDRYLFMVSFCAAILKYQTNLLPASKVPTQIKELRDEYPEAYVITDDLSIKAEYHLKSESLGKSISYEGSEKIQVDQDHIVAVVFTSGSTGKSKANIKTWRSLYEEAKMAIDRFELRKSSVDAIVATVPPQHMYGLETSIVIPLLAGISTVCADTFYPADIETAVNSAKGRCVLVTTPLHLKACVNAKLKCSKIKFIISATAMMPHSLAKEVENILATKLYEIYGASEFGSIATRRTLENADWLLYKGIKIRRENESHYISGPQLNGDVPINDIIKMKGDRAFELIGRQSDLIKIAGKRISINELNQRLMEIDGVIDGIFYVPLDKVGDVNQRLTAFVVAPGIDKSFIVTELKKYIDAVFLPRPIFLVDELPRNATGKLPYQNLQKLYELYCVN